MIYHLITPIAKDIKLLSAQTIKMFFIVIVTCLINLNSYAIREARPTAMDARIRTLIYNPNDVFKFTGYYNFQTSIELAEKEEVVSISMGDTTSWQITVTGHRIFIKPVEELATTNMTLITDKRTYFFELYAEHTEDIRDPNLIFNIKFIYPETITEKMIVKNTNSQTIKKNNPAQDVSAENIDMAHPEKYNFMYSISGHEEIAPIKIFDDGEFTYLQFRDTNYDMPAVLAVDEKLREAMVNFRPDPNNKNVLIIEHVFPKLVLRHGDKVTCIFNETYRKY